MSLFPLAAALLGLLRAQLHGLRHDDRGMTTETVIITATLAALAIAVLAIIVQKVTGRAEDIPVE